jgi:hypothetical protein
MKNFPCGKNFAYEIHENLAGGEITSDQPTAKWPVSKCRGPVVKEDISDAWLFIPRFNIDLEILPNKHLDDYRDSLEFSGST